MQFLVLLHNDITRCNSPIADSTEAKTDDVEHFKTHNTREEFQLTGSHPVA